MHELVDRQNNIKLPRAADTNLAVPNILLNIADSALVASTLRLAPEVQNAVRKPDLVAIICTGRVVGLPDARLRRLESRAGLFEVDVLFLVGEAPAGADVDLAAGPLGFQFGGGVDDLPVEAVGHGASDVAAALADVGFGRGAAVGARRS